MCVQEHLTSVKRDVEMWLEGEISDKLELDLGTGSLDNAVLRLLARYCPDKVAHLEREFQLKITERSMIFKGMCTSDRTHYTSIESIHPRFALHGRSSAGKPSQAEIAGEALRNLLSTLIKRELRIDDPVHVRWFTLDALRRPALDRVETDTQSAIQIQQMPAARVRERFLQLCFSDRFMQLCCFCESIF